MLLNKLTVHTKGLITKWEIGMFKHAIKMAANQMSMLTTTIIYMVYSKTRQPILAALDTGQFPIPVKCKNFNFKIKVLPPMFYNLHTVAAAINLYCGLSRKLTLAMGTGFFPFHANMISELGFN